MTWPTLSIFTKWTFDKTLFFSFLLTFRKLFWFCIVWQRCQIFFWPISHKNSQKIQIAKQSVATSSIMFLTWQILKPCPHTWLDICLKKVRLVKYWLRICPNRSQVVYLTRNIVILSLCSSRLCFFKHCKIASTTQQSRQPRLHVLTDIISKIFIDHNFFSIIFLV